MTTVVVDTSVVVKWFHAADETEVVESRALLSAHRDGALTAHLLDLGIYEIGNVLLQGLRWEAGAVADQIDDLLVICGPVLSPPPMWYRMAADLAERHALSFSDAMFAAAARATDSVLVSADRKLLAAGLAESAAHYTCRIGLT